MAKYFLFLGLALLSAGPKVSGQDSVEVMFWNVENFFDYQDEGRREFSSFGVRHWTKRRFQKKCDLIAKTVLSVADETGRFPDAIGLAEVENSKVLYRLIENTLLRKCGYRYITYESADPRGIDVALLYRPSRLTLTGSRPQSIYAEDGARIATRDILVATFVSSSGDSLALTVNHHPSKYGGKASGSKREAAVRTLLAVSDSLSETGWRRQIHVGDFNDVPESPTYEVMNRKMENLALGKEGEGSIKFDGRWELIDQALVSRGAFNKAHMTVFKAQILTEKDSTHSGTKPRRTYTGPAYRGGVSDHYPVLVCTEW